MRSVTTAPGQGAGSRSTGRLTRDVALVPVLGFCLLVGTSSYLMVFTLMGQIGTSLHASRAALDWITIATVITGTVSAALFPALGSVLGQRMLMTATMACLAGGSLISAIAPDTGMLIVGRIIAAPGFAAGSLAIAIAAEQRSGPSLPKAFGIITAFEGAAAGIGFVLGGAVEDAADASWRAVFLAVVTLSVIAGILAAATVPGGARTALRADILGALLLVAGLTAVLLPFSEGTSWGWTSPRVAALFAVAVLLLAAWVVSALTTSDPLIRLRILTRPGVAGGVLLFLITAGVVGIVNITVPAFLEAPPASGYGGAASVLQSGVDLLPFAAAITAAGYVSGRLTRRLSPSVIAIVTLCLEALGLVLLAGLHHTAAQVVILVALVGAGHGGTLAAEYVLLTRAVRPAEAGPAAGLGSAVAGISGAVATAAITPVLVIRLVRVGQAMLPAAAGYSHAWLCGAALAAAGAIVTAFLARKARGPAGQLPADG